MEKNYFLTYANSSLQDDPGHLHHFVSKVIHRDKFDKGYVEEYLQEEFDEYVDITDAIFFLTDEDYAKSQISNSVKLPPPSSKGGKMVFSFGICEFITIANEFPYENRTSLTNHLKQDFGDILKDEYVAHFLGIYDIAYQSVYGHNLGESYCPMRQQRQEILDNSYFKESKNPKCYECDQMIYKYILSEIVKGTEYHKIEFFEDFLELHNDCIKTRREIGFIGSRENDKKPFKYDLQKTEFVLFPLDVRKRTDRINNYYYINPFRRSILSWAFYDLTEFLLNNDRKELKYCPECNKFHVSKKLTKKFCSDKCRLAWHNRKRIESGEHRAYKRKKRMEGAKESYYG